MASQDRFANIVTIAATTLIADTLFFQGIETQLGFASGSRNQALGMLVDQIDYYIRREDLNQMTTSTDAIWLALTLVNTLDDIQDPTQRAILDMASLHRQDLGVAASGAFVQMPISHQFFPPLIHAERRMYFAVRTNGLAAIVTAYARIYYRTIELTNEDLLELVETFRLVG